MRFVIDPAIATKIARMQQRVCWQQPPITQRGIDQTRLVLADGEADNPEFSFLVLGDSGTGYHFGYNPQQRIAQQMMAHKADSRFVLHTGDVIYLVGAQDYYPENFIEPYRDLLVGGEEPQQIAYDQMVFDLPFLPVLGNHDYYDLPLFFGGLSLLTTPLRRLLRSRLDLDVGWRGSGQGDAFARAFMDYLKRFGSRGELEQHLDRHYDATTNSGRCLRYEPGKFTRLPNRYYAFRVGGIDFFALDSNTFNAPLPLPKTAEGREVRRWLEAERSRIDKDMAEILAKTLQLDASHPEESEHLNDLQAKLEQLQEAKQDIEKQLSSKVTSVVDTEQLNWLQQQLIQSWHTESVRGRVLYFHHPPYVTEASKWHQAQTLAVRRRLQQVLDLVAAVVGEQTQGRSIVDLVLNGHAHCLEHLCTLDTGHADSQINWLVCGGSGYSLRRQRMEGPELREVAEPAGVPSTIAKSLLFVGRTGHGSQKRRPYSFLRIDVKAGTPPKFVVRPYVSEWFRHEWCDRPLEPFLL